MKVQDLTGRLLDCWCGIVVKPEERIFFNSDGFTLRWHRPPPPYSGDWLFAGTLVDRFDVDVDHLGGPPAQRWVAIVPVEYGRVRMFGACATHAIARAVVASLFGDEVPDAFPFPAKPGERVEKHYP